MASAIIADTITSSAQFSCFDYIENMNPVFVFVVIFMVNKGCA